MTNQQAPHIASALLPSARSGSRSTSRDNRPPSQALLLPRTWLSAVGDAAGAPPPMAGMLLLMLSWLTVGDCRV